MNVYIEGKRIGAYIEVERTRVYIEDVLYALVRSSPTYILDNLSLLDIVLYLYYRDNGLD
jgi:hypothetical protein